jgi:hypothetical protein
MPLLKEKSRHHNYYLSMTMMLALLKMLLLHYLTSVQAHGVAVLAW